jgi:hypothetical protein
MGLNKYVWRVGQLCRMMSEVPVAYLGVVSKFQLILSLNRAANKLAYAFIYTNNALVWPRRSGELI